MARTAGHCTPRGFGTSGAFATLASHQVLADARAGDRQMDSIIYLVGLVVVIMFILSFLGLR